MCQPAQGDLLQGTLDVLILKTLTLQPPHGIGLQHRIAQLTHGAFEVKAGSLLPLSTAWTRSAGVLPVEESRRPTGVPSSTPSPKTAESSFG
jgi:hypothetical protein